MIRIFYFLATIFAMISTTFSQPPPIDAGVPQELAQWRAKHYSQIRYGLNLTLEKGAPLMKGNLEIRVTLDEEGKENDLILDWRTTPYLNDKDKPYALVKELNGQTPLVIEAAEHLRISRQFLKRGENIIKLEFASPVKTSGSAITRYIDKEDGAEYIYSLFVPSDASTAFPVFDQPDLKAIFSLELLVPLRWRTVSNAKITSMVQVSDSTRFRFAETRPISTYVFAFATGDFTEFSKSAIINGNIQVVAEHSENDELFSGIFVRKSQAEKFKPHAEKVFRLTRECVKYLEDYFDYKFPFPKYDLVLIPEFPFGGMEHAGATFLRENSIIFPSEPTRNDHISRATLIFHETAHQWFGDTVTMKWFDDLWLKEGFATFMGFKALNKIMPEMNAWKAFYERNKQSAYQTDSTRGTTPIYQEIPNLSAAKSAYGNIVYSKAPSFLKQAEFYLGEREFQNAVRSFLKKHGFSNATWQDLVAEFGVAKKQNLKDWGESWVTQKGMPIFRAEMYEDAIEVDKPKDENIHGIAFSPRDILGGGGAWSNKVKFLAKYQSGEVVEEVVAFDKEMVKHEENYKDGFNFKNNIDPLLIFPNYQDYGYGIFLLDKRSQTYIRVNVQNEKDDFLRAMMYGSLWDAVREAELDPKDYVELVSKNIANEKDETIVSSMLGRANTALNYYLDDTIRESLTPELEEILIGKMQSAETLGQRITFYRSFLNAASSERGKVVLKDILSSKFKIPDFKLKTKDKFDIVTKLFVLGDKNAANLLGDFEKSETSDDAKRYAYAARAGIAIAENKANYWNDFVHNKEIPESWIEAAFGPFNSVRHSNLTLRYLEKALTELPNHKRNRKIFFVNGWLGAFIGGQNSEEALKIVNKFLTDNPNLDRDLRLKILENVDVIERAVKIRKKFGK